MLDMEKVIQGLECCTIGSCNECPYVLEGLCDSTLMQNALALLKEQEEEINKLRWSKREPRTATEAWNAYMERRHGGKWDV